MDTARQIVEAARAKLPDVRTCEVDRFWVPIIKRTIESDLIFYELGVKQDFQVEFRRGRVLQDGVFKDEWEFVTIW